MSAAAAPLSEITTRATGGIWADETYADEADELVRWLRGLIRLEAEVLSL